MSLHGCGGMSLAPQHHTIQKYTKERLIIMQSLFSNFYSFIKKETVLTIAMLLAICTCFLVPPSIDYLSYIDWRVLGILFSLMLVMDGFQRTGLFQNIGQTLLQRTHNTKQLTFVLVFLCFFFSMLITNDVALITFVPFSILTLRMCKQEQQILLVVVLQTIAANLGSMLTPIGNPQNLYLFHMLSCSPLEFMEILFPYTCISGVLLIFCLLFHKKKTNPSDCQASQEVTPLSRSSMEVKEVPAFTDFENTHNTGKCNFHTPLSRISNTKKNIGYFFLFTLNLCVVFHLLPFSYALVLTLVVTFLLAPITLVSVDYALLLTFISFFVFIGNLQQVPEIHQWLSQVVESNTFLCGLSASQCISNVPAALLLSGFTRDLTTLLISVNLGGLGTLIASMASLISYKYFAKAYPNQKGKYFLIFTIFNLLFLLVLVLFWLFQYY